MVAPVMFDVEEPVEPASKTEGGEKTEAAPESAAAEPTPTTDGSAPSSRNYLEVGIASKWSSSYLGKDTSFPITVHVQKISYPGKRDVFSYASFRFGAGPSSVTDLQTEPEAETTTMSMDADFDGVLALTNARNFISDENHNGNGFFAGLVGSGLVHRSDYGFVNGSLGVILGNIDNHDNDLSIVGLTSGYFVADSFPLLENDGLYRTPYVGFSVYLDYLDLLLGREIMDARINFQGDFLYMSFEMATKTLFGFSVYGGLDLSGSFSTEFGMSQLYFGVDYRPKMFRNN